MPIKNRFAELLPQMTAWRRDFHQYPELQFDLPRTSARVAELLRSFGCDEVVEGIGRSGVVALIKGRDQSSGRVVGLRADMDALPIHEATGLDYSSKVAGHMHACGHDGHMAMLLGAAKYLSETRNFDGGVLCIFQPAEEGGGGGLAMVEAGMMERWGVDEVYAMHNHPGLALGEFATRKGAMWASTDQFEITVTGRGGHAAKPHETIDPMVISAQIIMGLQVISSRITNPLEQLVLSVCTISSDSPAHNVIPQSVVMRGTLRSFKEEVRAQAQARLCAIVEGIAATYGAEGVVDYQRGYPATVNHDAYVDYALDVAREIAGADRVEGNVEPQMAAEDFSYMLNARPGAYILVGNGESAGLHHPAYNFNDEAAPYGASFYAAIAEARLPMKHP